jgi:hypothetical protein
MSFGSFNSLFEQDSSAEQDYSDAGYLDLALRPGYQISTHGYPLVSNINSSRLSSSSLFSYPSIRPHCSVEPYNPDCSNRRLPLMSRLHAHSSLTHSSDVLDQDQFNEQFNNKYYSKSQGLQRYRGQLRTHASASKMSRMSSCSLDQKFGDDDNDGYVRYKKGKKVQVYFA